jgi:hypothetical protein
MAIYGISFSGSNLDLSTPFAMARSALQEKTLTNLGNAIESGSLASAKTSLQQTRNAFTPVPGSSYAFPGNTQNIISNDLDTLSADINRSNLQSVQVQWNRLECHLSDAGVVITDSANLAAEASALAQSQMNGLVNQANAAAGIAYSSAGKMSLLPPAGSLLDAQA